MKPVLLLPFLLAAAPLTAQSATAVRPIDAAAATITASDVARRVGIIAHDSMLGRDTPSRGLELTAQYIADEFKRFGLKPGGENGTWFQRYPLELRRLDAAQSQVALTAGGRTTRVSFSDQAVFMGGTASDRELRGEAYLLGGTFAADRIDAAAVKGKVVLLVADFAQGDRAARTGYIPFIRALREAEPLGVVVLSNQEAEAFARQVANQGRPSVSRSGQERGAGGYAYVAVRDAAAAAALTRAGVDVAAIRSGAMVARAVPGLTVALKVTQAVEAASAPNTIGILEGSDPTLRQEYLVYSAHMDHVGYRPGVTPDSIWNGADDDASGTIGVVELAEAFSRPGARPKRSVLFITVSGEEKGLWGSEYFSEHPTVPLGSMVANLNLDMIGRNWPDTIVAIGREHSNLGQTLDRVNKAHPELGMTAIDDLWPNERFYFRSDHFNFARKGVPILFFFNGTHDDYHGPGDEPSKINSDKEARILKLLFYLGQDIANAAERPQWNPESYQQIVGSRR